MGGQGSEEADSLDEITESEDEESSEEEGEGDGQWGWWES